MLAGMGVDSPSASGAIINLKLCVLYLQVYIRLHDKPLADSDAADDIDTANLTPKELKKLRSKQRRAQKKAQQQKEEEEQKKAHEKQGKNKHDPDLDGPKEEELVPEKLARVSAFLFVTRVLIMVVIQPNLSIKSTQGRQEKWPL